MEADCEENIHGETVIMTETEGNDNLAIPNIKIHPTNNANNTNNTNTHNTTVQTKTTTQLLRGAHIIKSKQLPEKLR